MNRKEQLALFFIARGDDSWHAMTYSWRRGPERSALAFLRSYSLGALECGTVGLGVPVGRHASEPDLAEIRSHPARAEQGVLGILRPAIHALERDTRILHRDHSAGAFVDDPTYALCYAKSLSTYRRQFLAICHSAILHRAVDGLKDLIVAFDFHQVSGM